MKILIVILAIVIINSIFTSCQQQTPPDNKSEIDSLRTIIGQLKPGLGEFMMQFEYHHDRLAKSIQAKDYERSAYETDEIKETAEKLIQLHITNEKLQQPFVFFYDKYLKSALENIADASAKKNDVALSTNYIALTTNCNGCHHENNMSFMKIEP
jgi:hypothetical protein